LVLAVPDQRLNPQDFLDQILYFQQSLLQAVVVADTMETLALRGVCLVVQVAVEELLKMEQLAQAVQEPQAKVFQEEPVEIEFLDLIRAAVVVVEQAPLVQRTQYHQEQLAAQVEMALEIQ
jgi:hypothetical protein